jgi:Tol biopolymer transport system component
MNPKTTLFFFDSNRFLLHGLLRIMRRFLALLVLVFIAGCVGTPTVYRYNATGDIVFMSRADSPHGELYVLNTTGYVRRLTFNDRHENNPALSRDGRKVAFHGGGEQDYLGWEIFVLDLETGGETQLTDNRLLDGHPDWSPDGTRVIYASFQDSQGNPAATGDLFIINLDTGRTQRLTDSQWENNDPEWSPDGMRIVFKSTRDTKQTQREEIYVMDSDGSSPRRLTQTSGWQSDHDPSWSPDSSSIVFMRFEGEVPWTNIANVSFIQQRFNDIVPWNVYSVDLGGNMQKLTDMDHIAHLPVWSPTDNQIMYIDMRFIDQGGQIIGAWHRLTHMNPDGSDKMPLMPDDRHVYTLEYFDW